LIAARATVSRIRQGELIKRGPKSITRPGAIAETVLLAADGFESPDLRVAVGQNCTTILTYGRDLVLRNRPRIAAFSGSSPSRADSLVA
jgi:hypothetical protein